MRRMRMRMRNLIWQSKDPVVFVCCVVVVDFVDGGG